MNWFSQPGQQSQNPFSQYSYLDQASPELRRQQAAQQFAQQMIGQPTQNVGQGLGQMLAGAGLGLAKFQKQGSAFPQAPGGVQGNLMTGLANFFTGRNNGGLK